MELEFIILKCIMEDKKNVIYGSYLEVFHREISVARDYSPYSCFIAPHVFFHFPVLL